MAFFGRNWLFFVPRDVYICESQVNLVTYCLYDIITSSIVISVRIVKWNIF